MRPFDRQRALKRPIEIEPFRLRHMERILEIERASFGKQAWPRRMFVDLYDEYPQLFLVAKAGRRIAGYMATAVEGRSAEIVSLAVDPDYRRRGLADALMRHTVEALRAGGVRRAELMVRPGNAAAQLYAAWGFRRRRLVRRYYEDGGDGILMTRALQ